MFFFPISFSNVCLSAIVGTYTAGKSGIVTPDNVMNLVAIGKERIIIAQNNVGGAGGILSATYIAIGY